MPGPPIRCMWYDDDGHPVLGECRSSDCTYVHPTNHLWGTAIRKKTASMNPPPPKRGRGRGRGFSSPSTRDSGWGGRKPSNDWDKTSWNNPPVSTTSSFASSSGFAEPSTHKQWGSSSKTGDATDTNSSGRGDAANTTDEKTGWGSSTDWGTTESAWGSGAWGSGWGDDTTKTTDGNVNGSTWGNGGASGDANKTTEGGSTWGTGTWGASDTSKTTERNTSGSAWGATGTANTKPNPIESSPIIPPPNSSRPSDLRVDVEKKTPVDAPIPPQSASSYRAASMAPSERTVCPTPQSAFPPFAVPRSVQNMTRSEIHLAIVKNSVRVTRIRLELKEKQKELDRWKATQLSQEFHPVSATAGARLNSIREDLKLQVNRVQERLKNAEDGLIGLPELPSVVPHLAEVESAIMLYTEQLRSWFSSFTALVAPDTNPPPSDTSAMDVDESNSQSGTASLLADLEERIAELEEALNVADGDIHSDIVSPEKNAAVIEEETARRKIRGDTKQSPEWNGPIAKLQSAAEGVQNTVDFHAEQAVLFGEQNQKWREEIEELERVRDENRRLLEAMQAQLTVFEKRKEERTQQIALLTQIIAQFTTNPRETPLVLDEGVLEGAQTSVKTMIQHEVVPALKAMGTRYTMAVDRRMTSLQQSIQPAVDQTDEICRRASEMQIET